MNDRVRSIPESSLRTRWIEDIGLPSDDVLVNATLRTAAGVDFEIDLVDLRHGIAAEYDGAHHAEAGQRARDARKDQEVYDAGLTMVRYNAPDLATDPPRFAAHYAARRAVAIERGCDVAARRLVQRGVLAERRLPAYRSAVVPLTLSRE